MELLTHGGEHHEIDDGGWLMMMTTTNPPSPEPRTDSRSALPREIRAWRWLRVIKHDETLSLIFFPQYGIYGVGVEVGGASGGPRDRGARPHPRGQGVGPLAMILSPVFLIITKITSMEFQVIPSTFISAQK